MLVICSKSEFALSCSQKQCHILARKVKQHHIEAEFCLFVEHVGGQIEHAAVRVAFR